MAGGGGVEQLKVLGKRGNPMTDRIEIALKLKGLQYEYVEEDESMAKCSSLFLENIEYQQGPVLLHAGRAIAKTTPIMEYIDETWLENPIMPTDPYERSIVRFWCHFHDDQIVPSMSMVLKSSTSRKELATAVEKVREDLKPVEEELRDGFFKGKRFFGGEKLGMLDIVFGSGSHWLKALDEVADVKLVSPEAFPLLSSWIRDFEEQEVVKATIPDHDSLVQRANNVFRFSQAPATEARSCRKDATYDADCRKPKMSKTTLLILALMSSVIVALLLLVLAMHLDRKKGGGVCCQESGISMPGQGRCMTSDAGGDGIAN